MAFNRSAFADIMKQENDIEERRVIGLSKHLAVIFPINGFSGENPVEGSDGVERVDVRCVSVVILVLDEAGKSREFREEAFEHPKVMHKRKHRVNFPGCCEDCAEAAVCGV